MISLDTMMVAACCLGLVYGAAHDIAVRTIPNTVSLCIGLAGLVHATRDHCLLPTLEIASLVLLLGLVAWRGFLLGGGDVKLMTAVSLWIRPHSQAELFILISILGAVLAGFYLLVGHFLPRSGSPKPKTFLGRVIRAESYRIRRRGSLPYGVAIASATIICLIRESSS